MYKFMYYFNNPWGGVTTPTFAVYADENSLLPMSDINEVEYTQMGEYDNDIPAGFTIESKELQEEPPLINSGLVLELPASMELEKHKTLFKWESTERIGARGDVSDLVAMSIFIDKTCTFTTEDGSASIDGTITYGKQSLSDENKLVAMWSSVDLLKGHEDSNNTVYKDIKLNAEKIWGTPGDYNVDLNVHVEINKITDGNNWDAVPRVTRDNLYGFKYGTVKCYNGSSSNILSIYYTYENFTNTAIDISEVSSNSVISSVWADVVCESLRIIKISGGDNVYYPCALFTLNKDVGPKSWAWNLPNLSVIVIPSNINWRSLHQLFSLTSGNDLMVDLMYNPEKLWDNTEIMLGDAMFFAKGRNDDGTWKYVPYIIFEGTKQQWKELSYYQNVDGKEWLFANAGNTVYVFCEDGTLQY